MIKVNRTVAFRLLAISWMGLIFYMSHQQSLPVPMLFVGQDKVEHFVVYAILGWLIANSFAPQQVIGWRRVGMVFAFTMLYGISDEYHQSFVPGRDASVLDALSDGFGGLFAGQIYCWHAQRWIVGRG